MVKNFLMSLGRPVVSVVMAVAMAAVSVAAVVWRSLPILLEAAGAVCLAVFAAAHLDHGAWLVAAVALVLKAAELDNTPSRRPQRGGRGITDPRVQA